MKKSSIDILSAAGYLLMVTGILLLLWNQGLFALSPVVIGAQLLGVFLMIWARVTFGRRSFHATASPTDGGLVTTGPYRYLRHPIYTSVLLFAWAGALGNLELSNAGFAIIVSAGAFTRVYCEEMLIRVQYPEYAEYAAKTKRFIPFLF